MAKVLLATDPGPPRTRGLLRACLEAAGHEVREVTDGEAALAEMAAVQPELLILDTALPALDGVQVLARLHAQNGVVGVPVLVISTIPAQVGRRLVESLGAAMYLRKPFAYEALGQAVEHVLAPHATSAPRDARAREHRTPRANGARAHPLPDAAATPPPTPRQRSAG